MAESNLEIIANSKKRIIKARKDIVLSLGNYVWKHFKVPTTNANGDKVKYKNGNTKMRKIGGIKEFKTHFSVMKKDPNINNRVISEVDYLAENYDSNYNLRNNPKELAHLIENTANAANDPILKQLYHMVVFGNINYATLQKIINKYGDNTDDDSSDDGTNNSNDSNDTNQAKPDQNDPSGVE